MASQAWKDAERLAAKALGGTRNSRGSDFGRSAPEVSHPLLSIEVKYRKNLPKLLFEGLEQAARYDKVKIPTLVVKERGKHGALVVLKLSDFEDLFGNVVHNAQGPSETAIPGRIDRLSGPGPEKKEVTP